MMIVVLMLDVSIQFQDFEIPLYSMLIRRHADCPHASFQDPSRDPNAPPRRSIETRALVIQRAASTEGL